MSVIYKIYCLDENIKDCYIGSTNDLNRRKNQHKFCCINSDSKNYNLKVYEFIRANSGWDNFDFIILEQFETIINKNDLFKIEGQYIKNNNATLNCIIAGRSRKEYTEDNNEKILEYAKKYYEDNKEKIIEYRKDNKKKIAENAKIYREENKEKSKKYREQNKEKLSENRKIKYEKNKIELNEKNKQKVKCEFCNSLVRIDGLLRHQKSKKCLDTQS